MEQNMDSAWTTQNSANLGGMSLNLTSLSNLGCGTTTYATYGWYPSYWYAEKDKTAQAFSIVKVLLDKNLVEIKKIRDFVNLVDEIAKVL